LGTRVFNGLGEAINGVWRSISETASSLWSGMRELAGQVWGSIVETFQTFGGRAAQAVTRLRDDVIDALGWLAQNAGACAYHAGVEIVNGLWDGISRYANRLLDWIYDFARQVSRAFESVLDIDSPSKVFASHGRNIMLGLRSGLESEVSGVVGTMRSIAGDLSGAWGTPSLGYAYAGAQQHAARMSTPSVSPAAVGPRAINVELNPSFVQPMNPDEVRREIKRGLRQVLIEHA
jgi:phage-related protein